VDTLINLNLTFCYRVECRNLHLPWWTAAGLMCREWHPSYAHCAQLYTYKYCSVRYITVGERGARYVTNTVINMDNQYWNIIIIWLHSRPTLTRESIS